MDKLSVMGSVVPKTELVLLSTKSGSRISYQNPVHISLIPRPFPPLILITSIVQKPEGEGLVNFITCDDIR